MFKYILVLLSLFTTAHAFAAGEVLTQECLQRVAAQAPLVQKSAVAVIRGEHISEYKKTEQVPVDVQVFNDAHDLVAALPYLAQPEVLEPRQIEILAAICAGPSFESRAIGTVIEALELPF